MTEGKALIKDHVDSLRNELIKLSHDIHDNPELGFKEFKAANWQAELLRGQGFEVVKPYCGLETSFLGVYKTGDGPRVAFLAEYDALNGLGHACGHNIIAASAVGAGLGLAHAMKKTGVPGTVMVMGTPAEEGEGGKIHLIEKGAFDEVDFALMIHPANENLIGRAGLAAQSVSVVYRGKAVHSARPEKGVNALTSLIALFNSIDTLRQVWGDTGRCNGIITKGGTASNVVPDLTEGKFTVRAGKKKELLSMVGQIKTVAGSAARLTGAELELSESPLFAERYPNPVIGKLFKNNMEMLGEKMNYPDPEERVGSSDIGNVSMVVPAVHEYLSICGPDVYGHTDKFRDASSSPRSDEVVLLAAKGLAMTGLDLLTDEAERLEARREFEEKALPNLC